MSTHEDLLATIRYVRDRTGDPNAWQTGLTPTEVTAVVTSTTRSEQLDAILRKIRQRHSNLYYPAPPDREQGDAARAIADAEAALAHQNSATAQLDLQVVSAILNAHLKTVEGGESLHELQQEIEAAVRIRSDLDTRRAASATSLTGADDRAMTDANPAFDTVHPSGHILVRSCRGGYMHSVSLSEAAMETDAETLAEAILLTADVSCLKALLEVRNEIVAAGHTPSAQVPTTDDLNVAIEKLLAHQLRRRNR